jgi:TPR repeat protein
MFCSRVLACVLAGGIFVVAGCKRQVEQGAQTPPAPQPTNRELPAISSSEPVLAETNPVSVSPATNLVVEGKEAPKVEEPKTNFTAVFKQGPGQEVFEQALAIIETNVTAAAAEEAVILFRTAAEKGNIAAQHALGIAYLTGLGIKKNADEAVKWLQPAADAGHPDAMFKLASLYAQGGDLPRNEQKASALARSAAERGHAEAQYNLATLYAAGRGVEKDMKEAAKWFQKAAESGHPTAQSNLGVLYATGGGVEKSADEALKWWQKAAEQGQPSAQFNLAHLYREGKGVSKDLTEAYKWYHLAAQQGDKDAALARDALAVDMLPSDVAEALKRSREFKARIFARVQQFRTPE